MNKKYIGLLVLFCLWPVISFAGTVTVTDQAGRQVHVKQPVNRVVTTFIPATLFALCADLEDALVGASNQDGTVSIYSALIDQDNPPVLVGNRSAGLSLETIFSLKPQLVIMYGQKDGIRLADRLTSMGVPALVIRPETMTGMKEALDLIGRASGRSAHTDRVINVLTRMETMMANRLEGQDLQKVYYAGSKLLTTVSGDMLQDEMIRMAGGINVSENTRGFFVTVSREQLISWNPQVVIAGGRLIREDQDKLYSSEFSSLNAVKENKIFKVPAETYWDFPSPLAMAGVVWMAGSIHPRVFTKAMVRDEINRFYDTIFGKGFSRRHPRVVGDTGGK